MAALLVYRAERFDVSIFVPGHGDVAASREKLLKKILTERRHIAGKNQVSFRRGGCERGFDAGERALSGEIIGDHRQPQSCIYCGIADYGNATADSGYAVSDAQRQRPAV